MLKQGREINTKISDLFKTSYGTVDVSSLRSIYLNMSTWVEPSTIKHKIHNQLNDSPFKDKTIVDLDLRASGIKPGKRSFLRCEVTLYLKELKYKDIKVPCISDSVINITDKIINETLLTSTVFRFYKSKK
jgi:hypothetical protein